MFGFDDKFGGIFDMNRDGKLDGAELALMHEIVFGDEHERGGDFKYSSEDEEDLEEDEEAFESDEEDDDIDGLGDFDDDDSEDDW